MLPTSPLAHLSDQDLIAEVKRFASREADATAALVASLAELDARRLYLGEGCSSLFTYCTQVLHLSEHAAYRRIEAARLARRFPVVLARLASREITLTALGLVGAYLTDENHCVVLDAARHQPKRAVEELVARLHPHPDVRTAVRKLPEPRAEAHETTDGRADQSAARPLLGAPATPLLGEPSATALLSQTPVNVSAAARVSFASQAPTPLLGVPPVTALVSQTPANVPAAARVSVSPAGRPPMTKPAVIRPLAPARYQFQVTLSAEGHAALRRAQDLMRHAVPNGDAAVVVERALSMLVAHLERVRTKRTAGPRITKRSAAQTETRPPASGGVVAPADERASATDEAGLTTDQADLTTDQAGATRTRRQGAGQVDLPHLAPAQVLAAAGQAPLAAASVPRATPASTGPAARRPGSRTRHIPAPVVREVWRRDEGRCAFVGPEGRCRETALLELHHLVPFGAGGSHDVGNLELRCRAHNHYEAVAHYGIEVMQRARQERSGPQTRSGPS